MIILSLVALALFGVSVALVMRGVALPRLKAAERVRGIEAYGYHTAEVPSVPTVAPDPVLAGVATGLGRALAKRFSGLRLDTLRQELLGAGMYRLSPHALLGYRILGLLVFAGFGLLVGAGRSFAFAILLGVWFGAIGFIGPLAVVRRRARHRLGQIERDLPELIDLLVVTVEAGMGLAASLQLAVTKFDGPLAAELRLALQEQRMGRSLSDALLGMLARADTPAMRSFVRSVTQGENLGVSIGTIMRNLAAEMRKRRRAHAEELAQKAPVKILFPLVFLILPPFILVILGPAMFNLFESIGS